MTADEQAEAILDACPDTEWRLLFALARYGGGLRVPSETLGLKWSDIDWANGQFVVSNPKTEHHQGHESREVPLFPKLLPHLREAFEKAEEGAGFCITRYRDQKVNLRTRLQWIIKRAGLKPWPNLWQNLRSTRETELADQFPAHVASAWIGNSVAVAVEHHEGPWGNCSPGDYRKGSQIFVAKYARAIWGVSSRCPPLVVPQTSLLLRIRPLF